MDLVDMSQSITVDKIMNGSLVCGFIKQRGEKQKNGETWIKASSIIQREERAQKSRLVLKLPHKPFHIKLLYILIMVWSEI